MRWNFREAAEPAREQQRQQGDNWAAQYTELDWTMVVLLIGGAVVGRGGGTGARVHPVWEGV